MKKAVITICALGLVHLGLSAQKDQGVVPSLVGWSYYGGDEFNGTIKVYGESMVIKQNIIVMNFMVITRNKVMLRYIATKW